ncbi:DNA-binding protein Ewg [Ooceraea biroi]|uniref:DNA-binding protein Ewg n=2 Tax=Ooceraea biroi TaxID=2015173 RepID=A0A026WQR5_OOCBI|nr:DNA-binding protein Ewg [Ooceraea biroi]
MRLSVMQENDGSDRGKSSENQLSDDEIIMDNDKYLEDNDTLAREEGSMISNLPLLFANGYPTSLEKITMAQLERFISFMVHCSLGHDTTKVINQPEWWPQHVKFSNPLMRPKKINDNWMANLKKLVFRCYTYHRSEYLLRFCSLLAQYPREDLEYINNWDSTTSLYHKSTGKLLVTFRNENLYYDRKNDSSRRTLLSHNASSSNYGNKSKQQQTPMMVQPPCDDIYLCDNCDAEFVGLAKMKEHEETCCEQEHGGSGSRSSTPDLAVEPELQQDQFLEYFQLFSNKTQVKSVRANSASGSDNGIVRRTSRRVRGSVNFARCATIPFSSPAGIVLAKKSKAMTEETQQERLDRIERHVIAPVLNDSCRPKWLDTKTNYVSRWIVSYKQNRDKLPADDYVHQYKFDNSCKPVLSIRSQLLYTACRPIYVVLTKLSEKQIDELRKNPSKYQSAQENINTRKILLTRKSGPACKTKPKKTGHQEQNAFTSSKRKAPLGDESDPIIVEDESTDISTSTAITKEALIAISDVKSCSVDSAETNAKLIKERKCSSSTITLIDLCSSDEEEDHLNVQTPCDENKDPMSSAESSIAKSLLRKFKPKQALCEALHLPRTLIDRLVIEQSSERR